MAKIEELAKQLIPYFSGIQPIFVSISTPVTIEPLGSIAFGSPPPTSTIVGTGLWIDWTGIYCLNADTQIATLNNYGFTTIPNIGSALGIGQGYKFSTITNWGMFGYTNTASPAVDNLYLDIEAGTGKHAVLTMNAYSSLSSKQTFIELDATTVSSIQLYSERLGFYTTSPIAQQTGVPITAAGIHAALVNLGLITA